MTPLGKPMLVARDDWRPAEVSRLLRTVATLYGLPAYEITGPSHEARFMPPRYTVARTLRARRYTLTQIGKYLGGRHHTTISHLLRHPPEACIEPELVVTEISFPDLSGEWAI